MGIHSLINTSFKDYKKNGNSAFNDSYHLACWLEAGGARRGKGSIPVVGYALGESGNTELADPVPLYGVEAPARWWL